MKHMVSSLPLAAIMIMSCGQAMAQPPGAKAAVVALKPAARADLQQFVGKWVQEGSLNLRFEIKLVEGKLEVLQVFPASGKTSPCENVVSDGKSLSFDIKLGQRKDADEGAAKAVERLPGVPQGAQVQVQTAQKLGLRLMLSEDRTALQGLFTSDLPLNGLPAQLKRVETWPPPPANAGQVVIRGGPGLPPQTPPRE